MSTVQIKVTPWCCTPTTPKQCPYQVSLPTSYCFQDISQIRFYRSKSLRQGQIKVAPWCCTPTPPNQCLYQVSTSYTLQFPRYSPDKIFKTQGHYNKVKGQIKVTPWLCTLTAPTNFRTKYQLPTPYGFWVTARKNIFPPPPIRTPGVKTIPDSS